jgi:phosphatidylglycerol:prolipoprotein diacylglycerol transferase
MTVLTSLLGARILFIILHPDSYQFTLSNIISTRGGFAYFGALAVSVAALWIYTVMAKKSFLVLMDYIAPFLMLSQVFVRIGCLMAGCCYGKPTGSAFGLTFKSVDTILRHPTQGYEAILLVAIYIVTRIVYLKKRDKIGYTFFLALFLYGIGRFFIEFFRVDSPAVFLNITLAQSTCLILAVISLKFLPKQ